MPDALYGDEVRIRQIIVNILNNAVKYTSHGYVRLAVTGERSDPTPEAPEGTLLLIVAVEDTGMGIHREDMDRLFTKFARMDLDHNKTIEGTGLGLAITKHLLTMMEGDIGVESVYGEGSTFTIRIPQRIISGEAIGDYKERFERSVHEAARYREAFQAPDACILVVDDTELNLQVVRTMLKRTRIQIETALSGAEALTRTKDKHFDLILMDQRMPGMDGTRALFEIRRQVGGLNHETPMICLTADAVMGARDRYMEKGFTDYLTKPIEGQALEELLSRYLPPEKVHHVSAEEAEPTEEGSDEPSALRLIYESAEGLSYEDAIHYQPEEQLREILASFYASIPAKSAEIEQLLTSDDIENYTTKVHALKSSARMLGMNSLSEQARQLEEAGDRVRAGEESARELIIQRTPGLLADHRAMTELFAPIFGGDQRENAPERDTSKLPLITDAELEDLLGALREYASILDYDDMAELLRQAGEYRLPESETERFAALSKAVQELDADRIMQLL